MSNKNLQHNLQMTVWVKKGLRHSLERERYSSPFFWRDLQKGRSAYARELAPGMSTGHHLQSDGRDHRQAHEPQTPSWWPSLYHEQAGLSAEGHYPSPLRDKDH